MKEIFKYGSVGGAPGNRCFYLEGDGIIARFTLCIAQPMLPHIFPGSFENRA